MEKMKPCACPSPLQIGVNGTINTSLTGGTYSITNNINIVGNVTWTNVSVMLGSNVRITIPAGSSLTLNHSHLFACPKMWEGIFLKDGGSLYTYNDAMIEDAYLAVVLAFATGTTTTSSVVSIENTIFNKCYHGITLAQYKNTAGNYPFTIRSCVFTCRTLPSVLAGLTTNALKSPTNTITSPLESRYINNSLYPLATLLPQLSYPLAIGGHSYTAIRLEHIGATTGANLASNNNTPTYYGITIGGKVATEYNVIDNHWIGVDALNSNLICYNTVFQNPVYGEAPPENTIGIRTRAYKGTLNQCKIIPFNNGQGVVTGTHNRFYNCRTGISNLDYFDVDIENASFRSIQNNLFPVSQSCGLWGCLATSSFNNHHIVSQDTFYNIANAISFTATISNIAWVPGVFKYSNNVFVEDNLIQPHPLSGITNPAYISTAIDVVNIPNAGGNQTGGMFGLGNAVRVKRNNLSDVYRGINVQDWAEKKVIVSENRLKLVQQVNTAFPSQFGISFLRNHGTAPSVSLGLNSVQHLIQNNTATGFSATTPSTQGIFIEGMGSGAPLEVRCNKTTTTERGIEFSANNNGPNYFWDNQMQNHTHGFRLSNNGFIGLQGGPNTPIDNLWSGTWTAPTSYMTYCFNSLSSTSPIYVRNSVGYNPDGVFSSANVVFNRYAVTLGSITTVMPQPFRACPAQPASIVAQSPIPHWEDIANQQLLYLGNTQAAQFIYEYDLYETLANDSTWRDSSAILDAFYQTNQALQYGKLYDIQTALYQADWTTASTGLSNFHPASFVETTYQDYFSLFLKYQTDTLDAHDSTRLFQIASTCVADGGMIVHQARALYNLCYETKGEFGDICSDGIGNRFAIHPAENNNIIVLSPNPTTGKIHISLADKIEAELEITLSDLSGRKVYNGSVNTQNGETDTVVSLTSGIYFIHIFNTITNENSIQKLIIQP